MDIVGSDFSFEKIAIELDILLTIYYPYNLEAFLLEYTLFYKFNGLFVES